ncbi:MAG: rod shape-determining protein RodA [bacterium]|nr:rod shape-determining protein RodA [bacterium]
MGRDFDYILFLLIIGLAIIGILMVFSATYSDEINKFWLKQIMWFGIGILGMIGIAFFNYHVLGRYAFLIYIFGILMLILVLMSQEIRHVKSWIRFGDISIQPSELAKLTTVIMLARYLCNKKERLRKAFFGLILPLLIIGIPMALILKQPDLGSTLAFLPVALIMLYVAGTNVAHLASAVAIGIITLVLLFIFILAELQNNYTINPSYLILSLCELFLIIVIIYRILKGLNFRVSFKPILSIFIILCISCFSSLFLQRSLETYQKKRLFVFINPGFDSKEAGYNIIQSKIAIGSGRLFGKGFLKGSQSQLGFLPEQQTDFIFSVVGEEWGFLGVTALLLLFLSIIYKGFVISWEAKDMFGSLLACGITSMFATQVIINIGMATGIIPVVGLPLVLISYGGSNLVVTMVSLGILLNIKLKRFS